MPEKRENGFWGKLTRLGVLLTTVLSLVLILSSPFFAPWIAHLTGYNAAFVALVTQSTTLTFEQTTTLSTSTTYSASTTYSTTEYSTSVTSTTTSLTTIYQKPSLAIEVDADYGWLPSTNGRLAIIPDNQSVTFQIHFKNNADFELDFWCCNVNIRYIPNSLHSNSSLNSYHEIHLVPDNLTTQAWVYGNNLPHFPGSGLTIITLTLYALDNSWTMTIQIDGIFTS